MLKVKDLSVTFHLPEEEVRAVRNISFNINKGETVALVGESGSGKTVTALSTVQLLPYPPASHPSGSILVNGVEVVGADNKTLRTIRGNQISMIFQEPMTSLNPVHNIERQISESLFLHSLKKEKAHFSITELFQILFFHKSLRGEQVHLRTIELLKTVGLAKVEDRLRDFPHQFSGGERQRIMIAMALANEPDLLIADEPTTALDVTIQAQILKLLKDLQKQFGMAILLITHDLAIVHKVADRVCVMQKGEIVETGTVDEVYNNPQHPYTKHLLESRPKPMDKSPEAGASDLASVKNLKVYFPKKRKKKKKSGIFKRIKEYAQAVKTKERGIFRRPPEYVRAVDGVSLILKEGYTLGVVGESGSGKTTLGLAFLRLEKSNGDIIFRTDNIQGWTFKKMRPLRQEMQMVFQDPGGSLNPRLSIGQIIEEGLLAHGLYKDKEEREQIVQGALVEVGIEPEAINRYPHEFSGGQRQRIAVARALVLKPKLIVLDEPTSSIDMTTQAQVIDLLRDLQEKYKLSYLFISHDLQVIQAICDEIIVMKDGHIVEFGPTQEVINNPKEPYTKALMKAAFELEAVEDGTVSM